MLGAKSTPGGGVPSNESELRNHRSVTELLPPPQPEIQLVDQLGAPPLTCTSTAGSERPIPSKRAPGALR